MPAAPIPTNEEQRLEALQRYDVLDSQPEPRFDRLTDLATWAFAVPIALISLVDRDRLWFQSACGLEDRETPRSHAFCAYTIHEQRTLVIEDAATDPRFAENPLVTGPPYIRFYAGAPLVTPDGYALGTLCILDREPRRLSAEEAARLEDLASLVVDELELRSIATDARRLLDERVELIATVTHEIRNPLTGALGMAELLVTEKIDPEERREMLESIVASMQDIDVIIEDLLLVSRADNGALKVHCREVPLRHELDTVIESMEFRDDGDVPLVGDTDLWAEADPIRLRQIFRNLLINADRYGGDHVEVQMRAGDPVIVEVRDDGDGVARETMRTLFEPFSGDSERHHSSMGLGLAVSRRLARAMGGNLEYHREDGVTVFRLTLVATDTGGQQAAIA